MPDLLYIIFVSARREGCKDPETQLRNINNRREGGCKEIWNTRYISIRVSLAGIPYLTEFREILRNFVTSGEIEKFRKIPH